MEDGYKDYLMELVVFIKAMVSYQLREFGIKVHLLDVKIINEINDIIEFYILFKDIFY